MRIRANLERDSTERSPLQASRRPPQTREMAADYAALLRNIGMENGSLDLWGVSQGGMISQWLAIDHGELLHRLCLTVTVAGATEALREAVGRWMELAREDRYGPLMRDTMRATYTPKHLRRYAIAMPFLGLFGKPGSFRRFLIQAQACLDHDARDSVGSIRTPTLVLGGGADGVVGPGTSEELARLIPNARLELYPELGHGAFDEAKDATPKIVSFFEEEES
ncbi:MAG: alpha/beta fold hydrolase [Spirochaetota bacterium]